MLKTIIICVVLGMTQSAQLPWGGPPGAKLMYDLLSNNQPGINYPSDHVGAFFKQVWPEAFVNQELQAYVKEAVR